MNDLQVLKGIQQEKEKPAAQSFTPYEKFSMIDDVEVLMKDIYTFLRKFSRIPFGVTPKVILIAWERFGEIKYALTDEQFQLEDIQELMSKLLEDVQNISEELSKYINFPSWNRPIFYNNDDDEDNRSLITIIESLNYNPTPDRVLKSPSLVPISITDSNSFFEKSDTSLSYSDKSLPKFETLSVNTEETRSWPVEPDQGGLTSIVMDEISDNSTNDPLLEFPEFESFHFDPSFPHTPPEPPDVEISLIIETDAPVINNFDELNEDECFDPGVKTPFLTPASSLRAGGISSGWNFHVL
ncbi:hypothetical protein Tco_0654180 [Tanacetum coccineum]|uniref:Uncharacterized protein n=1 Tax=Tanacetum coccineum TaxID=301880 RepID=A0ABQ4X2H8_9ASTR